MRYPKRPTLFYYLPITISVRHLREKRTRKRRTLMMKPRIFCLDVGDKRIGIAVNNPLNATAQALKTWQRQNFEKDCQEIFSLLKEYDSHHLVIGIPLDLEHQEGPQAKKVRYFADSLKQWLEKKSYPVTIEWWDESFTSEEAEEILLEADLSRKKRRKVKDKLAASLILQSYLDSKC